MRSLVVLFLALTVVGGVFTVKESSGGAAAQVLIERDLEFGRAAAARGLDGWLAFFADDAAIFPPNGAVVRGLGAIRAHYAKTAFTPKGLSWKPVAADLAASGELGYTYGYWEYTAADKNGKTISTWGKYSTVWKKQVDGSWKVVLDIGNDAAADAPKPW